VTVRVKTRTLAVEADEISRANYEPLKEEVLRAVGGKLRSKGMSMISQDLEVAYNEAWHQLTQHIIRGKPLTSLSGLLYKMTYSRAVDIYRSPQERRRVDLDLEQHQVETDIAEQLDDQEKLARLLGRLKDRLNDKERNAVTLCTLHGYTRPEAADKLGIDRIVFERIMDGATKKMSGIVESIEARGCGEKEWTDRRRRADVEQSFHDACEDNTMFDPIVVWKRGYAPSPHMLITTQAKKPPAFTGGFPGEGYCCYFCCG